MITMSDDELVDRICKGVSIPVDKTDMNDFIKDMALLEYTKHVLSKFIFIKDKEPTDKEIFEVFERVPEDYFSAFCKVYHYFGWEKRICGGPFPPTRPYWD